MGKSWSSQAKQTWQQAPPALSLKQTMWRQAAKLSLLTFREDPCLAAVCYHDSQQACHDASQMLRQWHKTKYDKARQWRIHIILKCEFTQKVSIELHLSFNCPIRIYRFNQISTGQLILLKRNQHPAGAKFKAGVRISYFVNDTRMWRIQQESCFTTVDVSYLHRIPRFLRVLLIYCHHSYVI